MLSDRNSLERKSRITLHTVPRFKLKKKMIKFSDTNNLPRDITTRRKSFKAEISRRYSNESMKGSEDEQFTIQNLRKIGTELTSRLYSKIFNQCKTEHETLDVHRFIHKLKHLGLTLKDPRLVGIERKIELCQVRV